MGPLSQGVPNLLGSLERVVAEEREGVVNFLRQQIAQFLEAARTLPMWAELGVPHQM